MTLDQAYTALIDGARMTAAHMPAGCYLEHVFKRGFVRCWPVAKVEDEPNRDQCDFVPNDDDRTADWHELERPKVTSWGKPLKPALDLSAFDPDIAAIAEMPQADFDAGIVALKAEAAPKRDSWGRPIG